MTGTFHVPQGAVSLTVTDGDANRVSIETEFIVNDVDYVLKTNDNL